MTPCHHGSEVISLTKSPELKGIAEHTLNTCFRVGNSLIYGKLWVMELSQLIRGHRRCPVTSQMCKRFCFRADNTLPFHNSSGFLLQGDGESLSAYSKKSYLKIFPNSCTSSGSNPSCSTEGVPAPPAYPPPPHHENIKGTGKENQNPECLAKGLGQKEWKVGEHRW